MKSFFLTVGTGHVAVNKENKERGPSHTDWEIQAHNMTQNWSDITFIFSLFNSRAVRLSDISSQLQMVNYNLYDSKVNSKKD